MQDMIPKGDRSIRNIPVPANHRHAPRRPVENEETPAVGGGVRPPRRRRSGRRLLVWGIAVVLVAAVGGILVSVVFAGATVNVYPKTAEVTAPNTIPAQLNAPVGTLAFQNTSVTRSATTTVPATGTQQVSRQASGVITVFNNYSTQTQRLIANTRFEAPDGKIYRIRDSVVVPGMSGTNPGSVSATVYADSPGPDYNRSGETTFTIPGFQGDPRFEKFSAQSDGPISGGFVGEEPSVAESDLAQARATLQQQLDESIRAAFTESITEGSFALPGTLQITYSDLVQAPGEGGTAELSQQASATGAVVRESDLATAIARLTLDDYQGEAIGFKDAAALSVAVASSSADGTELVLQLAGNPTLVWQFDPNALKQALIGKNKDSFEQIIRSFEPAVLRADASIRPFWHNTFPADPEKVKVVAEEGE